MALTPTQAALITRTAAFLKASTHLKQHHASSGLIRSERDRHYAMRELRAAIPDATSKKYGILNVVAGDYGRDPSLSYQALLTYQLRAAHFDPKRVKSYLQCNYGITGDEILTNWRNLFTIEPGQDFRDALAARYQLPYNNNRDKLFFPNIQVNEQTSPEDLAKALFEVLSQESLRYCEYENIKLKFNKQSRAQWYSSVLGIFNRLHTLLVAFPAWHLGEWHNLNYLNYHYLKRYMAFTHHWLIQASGWAIPSGIVLIEIMRWLAFIYEDLMATMAAKNLSGFFNAMTLLTENYCYQLRKYWHWDNCFVPFMHARWAAIGIAIAINPALAAHLLFAGIMVDFIMDFATAWKKGWWDSYMPLANFKALLSEQGHTLEESKALDVALTEIASVRDKSFKGAANNTGMTLAMTVGYLMWHFQTFPIAMLPVPAYFALTGTGIMLTVIVVSLAKLVKTDLSKTFYAVEDYFNLRPEKNPIDPLAEILVNEPHPGQALDLGMAPRGYCHD